MTGSTMATERPRAASAPTPLSKSSTAVLASADKVRPCIHPAPHVHVTCRCQWYGQRRPLHFPERESTCHSLGAETSVAVGLGRGHPPSSCRSASIDIAICAQCHVEMEPAMPATRVGGGGVDGGEMKLMFSCVGEDIVVDWSVMWVMAVEGRREESG